MNKPLTLQAFIALAKSDTLAGDAKTACVATAKSNFGKT